MKKASRGKHIDVLIAEADVFDVSPEKGLSQDQINSRIASKLVNKTRKHVSKTYARIVFDNVFNFMNVILFLAFIAMLLVGLSLTHYFFMVILFSNIIIGLIQDIHARRLTDKLRIISDPKARVIRDGEEKTIDAAEIVLSDVLVLGMGDQIPADCRVLEGGVRVDESMLTGEAERISKNQYDSLFSGTYIVSGSCKAVVTKVGLANYAEKIQSKASGYSRPASEIQSVTWRVMVFCGVVALIFSLVNFIVYLSHGLDDGHSLAQLFDRSQPYVVDFVESAAGSVVAMLPAGMFLLTSLTLAVGVIQLAKRRILVQQMQSIESLARVDTICFDKTGTLTDGTMEVESVIPFNKNTLNEIGYAVSSILHFTGDHNPTALALRKKFGDTCSELAYSIGAFDSETKHSYVSLQNGFTYAIGAYDFLPVKKDSGVEKTIRSYAEKGMRCLVLASSEKMADNGVLPKNMNICAIIIISDHLKSDAKDNIAWFQSNDVKVYVISGDDPLTVSQIAEKAGVNGASSFISLSGMNNEELPALLDSYSVFGRVSPEQKATLISELKNRGHKVAMTGDGVNDVLALKVADCSIAMASGADAAKNVAHLVSLNNDFSKLPDVVAEGRRVINNLQRTCSLFLTKTLFAMVITFVFLLLSFFMKRPGTNTPIAYPYSTSNLLIWEVFSIGLPAFFLALQPSHERLEGSFLNNMLTVAVPSGFTQVVAALGPFVFASLLPQAIAANPGDPNQVYLISHALSVMVFSFTSLAVLARTCYPFDSYRSTIFVGAAIFSVSILLTDYFLRGRLLAIYWENYAHSFYLVIIGSAIIGIGLYVLFDRVGGHFRQWRKKK